MVITVPLSDSRIGGVGAYLSADYSFDPTNSNPNIDVTMYPTWYKEVSLEWTIPDEWVGCKFNVYESNNPVSGFKLLTPVPITTQFFTDNTDGDYFKRYLTQYVVEVIFADGRSVCSENADNHVKQNSWISLRSKEIQRRHWLVLSKFNGVKSFLFRRKTSGERCHTCWNHRTEKALVSACPDCYGTTFKGGYSGPIPTLYKYEPSNNQTVPGESGYLEPNQIQASTIAFPEVTNLDIIVKAGDWAVYRIIQNSATEMLTNPVTQTVLLSELERADVNYHLIKDFNLKELSK